jgi:hypothetical protein
MKAFNIIRSPLEFQLSFMQPTPGRLLKLEISLHHAIASRHPPFRVDKLHAPNHILLEIAKLIADDANFVHL